MTVHVSDGGVKVTVAVLKQWRAEKVLGEGASANWLIMELLAGAGRAFADAGRAHALDVAAHKLDAVKLGDSLYSIAQCASDRPGFSLTEQGAGEDQPPSLYCYLAMGLPEQHPEQQTLLARCSSVATAAVYVAAVQRLLGLRLRAECVAASQEPERARTVRDELALAGVKFAAEEFDREKWMNNRELLQRAQAARSDAQMVGYLRAALPARLQGALAAFAELFAPS
jgi:hypothetical protein